MMPKQIKKRPVIVYLTPKEAKPGETWTHQGHPVKIVKTTKEWWIHKIALETGVSVGYVRKIIKECPNGIAWEKVGA